MRARIATPDDAAAIARIYNEAIEERIATFETRLRTEEEVRAWFDGVHPIVVVEDDDGAVVAFARTAEYSSRACYDGVFEFAVYVAPAHRRRGAGTLALRELVTRARAGGAWKLVSRIFVENAASRALVAALGFREIGVYYRHAKLDGRFRDVVAVEKFLAPLGAEAATGPLGSRSSREAILTALGSADPQTRADALEPATVLLGILRRPDAALLEAVVDAFFARRDGATRARFVDLFRTYAALSTEAAREAGDALFARLGRMDLALDLDTFYEALFVVKQLFGTRELAPHAGRLVAWIERASELPPTRGRITPGNLTSLLLVLANAACETDEQRIRIADLAAAAQQRHRVETPPSMRPRAPSLPPPPPPPAPPPLPKPKKAAKKKEPKKKAGSRRKRTPPA